MNTMETFNVRQYVRLNETAGPALRNKLGDGPFRVVGVVVLTGKVRQDAEHPENVRIELADGIRHELSGARLTKV